MRNLPRALLKGHFKRTSFCHSWIIGDEIRYSNGILDELYIFGVVCEYESIIFCFDFETQRLLIKLNLKRFCLWDTWIYIASSLLNWERKNLDDDSIFMYGEFVVGEAVIRLNHESMLALDQATLVKANHSTGFSLRDLYKRKNLTAAFLANMYL